MDTPNQRLEMIFHEALRIADFEERFRYVVEACAGDEALEANVRKLLASHDDVRGTFLSADPEERAADAAEAVQSDPSLAVLMANLKPEEHGDRVGPYKLLQEIGAGGFGTVWMADQERPVRRRVALKIIKLGMDTKEVIGRFEQERQALALMDHPNIAKVLDAGSTETGRPFFAMELVRGIPITEYCDTNSVGMEDRLKLFVQVCQAVQHAHQKGIIHRDLKPSNILVTMQDGVPLPKVIDFGVAKAMQQRLTDISFFTRLECMVGTPLYMSPEQAEMSSMDIDTRSDIYSLGVLLYELLTGTTPFDPEEMMRRGLDEVRRVIREDEPPRPSTALTSMAKDTVTAVARNRRTEGARLIWTLKGDLDWIVMRALEKDRTRRYGTATDLAQDIQRHLTSEPVLARPPSSLYRFRRTVRRNKVAFAAAAAVAAALAIGAIVSAWQAVKLKNQRDEKDLALRQARSAEADTKAFSEFLVQRLLSTARPKDVEGGLGIDVTVARALADAEKELAQDFAGRPLAEALARDAIGVTWESHGRYDDARQHFQRALELRTRELGANDPATLTSANNLAVVLLKTGDLPGALRLHADTLHRREAVLGADHAHTLISLNNLASAYRESGNLEKALELYEQLFERSKQRLSPTHPDTLKAMNNLARAYRDVGQKERGLRLQEEALEICLAQFTPNHPVTLTTTHNLSAAYADERNWGKALPLYERVVEGSRETLGKTHVETEISLKSLAAAYENAGDPAKAVPLYEELLQNALARGSATSPEAVDAVNNLAFVHEATGGFQEARRLFEQVLASRMATLGTNDPSTVITMNNLAAVLEKLGELKDALPLFERALALTVARSGSGNADAQKIAESLARICEKTGDSGKAESVRAAARVSQKDQKTSSLPDSPR